MRIEKFPSSHLRFEERSHDQLQIARDQVQGFFLLLFEFGLYDQIKEGGKQIAFKGQKSSLYFFFVV